MYGGRLSWLRKSSAPLAAVELFAAGNLAFLALDVYIAHSSNSFDLNAEWIPVVFSLVAPVVLLIAIILQRGICPAVDSTGFSPRNRPARWLGMLTGGGAVVVGIAGLLWHLNSQFFQDASLENLIYTAPFIAPLSYTGVGLLLILNRMVPADTEEWGRWVVLLALGGFVGNFILSLFDHAQNGFFETREWIPVVAAALAVGSLSVVVFIDCSPASLKLSAGIMAAQMIVGVLGVYYHQQALFASHMDSWWEKLVYSAPIFAPLLFDDLAILALLGFWALWLRQRDRPAMESGFHVQ